jgi:5-methylcytosine-specific restriction endonuclease McrA
MSRSRFSPEIDSSFDAAWERLRSFLKDERCLLSKKQICSDFAIVKRGFDRRLVDLFGKIEGDTVEAYAEWTCQSCGVVPERWVVQERGPHLAAMCPECGSRVGSSSDWISKAKIGAATRTTRSTDFAPKVRARILERDDFTCTRCGRSAGNGVLLVADHVVPVALGGESTLENGTTLCEECNAGKGARLIDGSAQ